MKVYRLSKEKYKTDLSGKGAELAGGRWNSKGIPMLYTSESRALCTAEIAVHTPLGILPTDYHLVTIEIPDTFEILELDTTTLPSDWKTSPPLGSTQDLGDEFINHGKYLIMKVPSAVIQGDFNYLFNPMHKLISEVKIKATEPFEFDERLFKK
jgi:RES domain-containing protein